MKPSELIKEIEKCNRVVIIGAPASGKTTISKTLEQHFTVIHTDDYIGLGYDKALYSLMEDLNGTDGWKGWIVEGVLGYRLLRKLRQIGQDVDLIIECERSLADIEEVYRRERNADFNRVKGMIKANDTVYQEYKRLGGSARVIKISV